VLNQFYQAGLIAKVDYADVLVYCAPWMLLLGLGMSGITAYATLRAYIRR
jgi:cell division transport system permease protein